MESNEKAAMVIDHDIYFVDIVSDSYWFSKEKEANRDMLLAH